MNKRNYFLLLLALVLAVTACKKNKNEPSGSRTELTLDSIFLYAQQVYYWNDKLPSFNTFNPRKYNVGTDDLVKYENAVFGIANYSPNRYDIYKDIDGVYQNFPKFSSIDLKSTSSGASGFINPVSSVELDGEANDIGIRFGLYGSETNYSIYVAAVYQNSPAERQGVTRGDLVKKVNGISYGTRHSSESSALNAALSGNTVKIEGFKVDGVTPFTYTLAKEVFKTSPIYKVRVIDAGAKKIGYLAYARFSDAENSIEALNGAFKQFSDGGVTDLVIDLRYNGGGYVSTAEHLINLIAPSTTTGVMFSEHYNTTMQTGNAKILANQFYKDTRNNRWISYANADFSVRGNTISFSKKGAVNNVRNVVFLVSSSTASSSELVINSLKPHMNVTLVGRTTYGKPIGFFPITLEDNKYEMYLSMFETKNSLGQGGFYTGMNPDFDMYELTPVKDDKNITIGYKMVAFGDIQDVYLAKAIAILAPGATVVNNQTTMGIAKTGTNNLVSSATSMNVEFTNKEFKGMVENRFKPKE